MFLFLTQNFIILPGKFSMRNISVKTFLVFLFLLFFVCLKKLIFYR